MKSEKSPVCVHSEFKARQCPGERPCLKEKEKKEQCMFLTAPLHFTYIYLSCVCVCAHKRHGTCVEESVLFHVDSGDQIPTL